MEHSRITKLIVTVVAFAFLGDPALAQDQAGCNGTNYEMRVCFSTTYEKSDAELNAVYRAVLKELAGYLKPVRHIENLRMSERRWMAYRDAQCKAQYDLFEGGSGGPIENLGCLIELTDRRTAELRQTYLSPR